MCLCQLFLPPLLPPPSHGDKSTLQNPFPPSPEFPPHSHAGRRRLIFNLSVIYAVFFLAEYYYQFLREIEVGRYT